MALHTGEATLTGSLLSQSSLTLYLALRIEMQRLSLLDATNYASFARSALFIFFALLNPKPPSHFGLQRLSHAVRARNFPSDFFGFHQNLRESESNLL